jgi:hypothetical protein
MLITEQSFSLEFNETKLRRERVGRLTKTRSLEGERGWNASPINCTVNRLSIVVHAIILRALALRRVDNRSGARHTRSRASIHVILTEKIASLMSHREGKTH